LQVQNLSFRKKYFIAGNYYRLNAILDYSPDKRGLVTLELYRVVDLTPLSPNRLRMHGGSGTFNTDDMLPVFPGDGLGFGLDRPNGQIGGGDVYPGIGGQGEFLHGGGVIGGGVLSGVLSSANVSASGERQVMINNSQTHFEDETTMINDLRAFKKLVVELTAAEVSTLASSPIDLLPECGGGKAYEVQSYARRLAGTTYGAHIVQIEGSAGAVLAAFDTALISGTTETAFKAVVTDDLEVNSGILLTAATEPSIAGTGNIIVVLLYRVIDL